MAERLNLNRSPRDRASTAARAQDIRQDNISRRVTTISGPNNPFNNPSRDNYQTYPYDYFSGADAKIFFGDVWVDDIVTIQYNVNQQKNPIWGYASQYFDAVAKGQVIVQGTLSIAFKETGYLNVIQALLERQRRNDGLQARQALEKYRLRAEHRAAEFIPGLNLQQTSDGRPGVVYSANGTPQFIRQSQTIEQILQNNLISEELSTEGETFNLSRKARDFEDFAELLEDTIWGDSNGRPYEAKTSVKLQRADEFDYNRNGGIKVGKSPYSDVLNIVMTFGDINDFRAEHTIISLNDVHFQSQGMIVSPDGTPIAENYTFFARDINDQIGNSQVYRIDPIKLETGVDDLEISRLEAIDALNEQLVQERIPQFIKIVGRAALPRGGLWKPLDRGELTIVMDQAELTGNIDDRIDNEQEKVARFITRGETYNESPKFQRAFSDLVKAKKQKDTFFAFSFNAREPLVDQVIGFVEREFNEFDGNTIDTRNSQYIVDVEFSSTYGGDVENTITMVLEQSVPSSRTYRVIAPTRQNFGAANILTREDLFRDIQPAAEFNEELNVMGDELQQKQRQALSNRQEFEDELTNLTENRIDQLRKDMVWRNERIEELQEEANLDARDEQRLRTLERQQAEAQANLAVLTDDVFNEDDIAALRRKDRDNFEAALDDYDRFSEEAQYFGNEEQRIREQQEELVSKEGTPITESQQALIEDVDALLAEGTPEVRSKFGIGTIEAQRRKEIDDRIREINAESSAAASEQRRVVNEKLTQLSEISPSEDDEPEQTPGELFGTLYKTSDTDRHVGGGAVGSVDRKKDYVDSLGNIIRYASDFAPLREKEADFLGSPVPFPFETGEITDLGTTSLTVRTRIEGRERDLRFEHLEIADGLNSAVKEAGGRLALERGTPFARVGPAEDGAHLHIDTQDIEDLSPEEFEDFISGSLEEAYQVPVVDPFSFQRTARTTGAGTGPITETTTTRVTREDPVTGARTKHEQFRTEQQLQEQRKRQAEIDPILRNITPEDKHSFYRIYLEGTSPLR